jgi:hypothetical protein
MNFPIDLKAKGYDDGLNFTVRFTAETDGKVIFAEDRAPHKLGSSSRVWADATNTDFWEPVNNPTSTSVKVTETRGNGGATSYYELPKGATELGHLISHKHMEHGIGEMFCALYRLNDNGEYLRNLEKVKYYAEAAIAIHKERLNDETRTTI